LGGIVFPEIGEVVYGNRVIERFSVAVFSQKSLLHDRSKNETTNSLKTAEGSSTRASTICKGGWEGDYYYFFINRFGPAFRAELVAFFGDPEFGIELFQSLISAYERRQRSLEYLEVRFFPCPHNRSEY
jgi:hypothetical protein